MLEMSRKSIIALKDINICGLRARERFLHLGEYLYQAEEAAEACYSHCLWLYCLQLTDTSNTIGITSKKMEGARRSSLRNLL